MEILNLIIGLLGAGIGSGIMMIFHSMLQRRWQKNDKAVDQMDAQTEALKVIMIDRVKQLGREYIKQGYILVDDKETIKEMYQSYKRLGGNGQLSTIMGEINKLEVRG